MCTVAACLVSGCLLVESFDGEYSMLTSACDGQWSQHHGNAAGVTVGGIARDSESKLYVVGTFTDSLTVGIELIAKGTDSFVASFDNDGNFQHAVSTNAAGHERATAIATQDTTLIIAGSYSADFGGCTNGLPADGGIFVSFGTPGLAFDQTACLPVTGGDADVSAIAFDGNLARVAGSFRGTLLGLQAIERDGYVVSLDRTTLQVIGTPVLLSGAGEQRIEAIATRGAGGGFVSVGWFDSELSINGGPATATQGGADAFAILFDGAAAPIKPYFWGAGGDEEALAVAAADGDIYVTGEIDNGDDGSPGLVALGPTKVVQAPEGDLVGVFVASLPDQGSQLGEPKWAIGFSAEDMDVQGIGVSSTHVYVGGTVDGTLEIGGDSIRGHLVDLFVSRLARDTGAYDRTSRCGDANEQRLIGLVVDPVDDDVFFAGELKGSINFGELQRHTASGANDLLLGEIRTPE